MCETCGYTLDGLTDDGNCPECGQSVRLSRLDDGRTAPAWERPGNVIWRFADTTGSVIVRPSVFYRTLATRQSSHLALAYGRTLWVLSALLLGGALYQHAMWFGEVAGWAWTRSPGRAFAFLGLATVATYLVLWLTTRLAALLTAWEAAYRGYRLPKPVVLRGLYYHAAHYLPVGLIALATTGGYRFAVQRQWLGYETASTYLIVLCVEVVVLAGYLFRTYWAGMRNMMYANR